MTVRASSKSPVDELDEIQRQGVESLRGALNDYARCVVSVMNDEARDHRHEKACLEALAERFATLGVSADILGRTRALREVKKDPVPDKACEHHDTIQYRDPPNEEQSAALEGVLTSFRVGETRTLAKVIVRRVERTRWTFQTGNTPPSQSFDRNDSVRLLAEAYVNEDIPYPDKPPADAEPPLSRDLPNLMERSFQGAVEDLARRVPELAVDQNQITDVYGRGGFALVRSTDQAITEKVQDIILRELNEGRDRLDTQGLLKRLDESFTGPYLETVVRNATNRAYAAGRQQQAQELNDVVGLEFQTVGDEDVRENHEAADGLIAAVDDPIWDQISPPLGHRCRCNLGLVTRTRAIREGLLGPDGKLPRATLPPGAHPDPGGSWGKRADSLYQP